MSTQSTNLGLDKRGANDNFSNTKLNENWDKLDTEIGSDTGGGLKKRVKDVEGTITSMNTELDTAQSDINTIETEMNTAQTDISQAKTDIDAVEVEVDQAQAEVDAVEVQIGDDTTAGNIKKRIKDLENRENLAGYGARLTVVESNICPSGAVMSFARSIAPTGWLKCSGQAVSRTTYAAPFSAIGTTFGTGDGSTTFNLPDMRGEFVRGWVDDKAGVNETRTFGSSEAGTVVSTTGSGFRGYIATNVDNDTSVSSGNGIYFNSSSASSNTHGEGTVRPRNIALLYCIKI